MPAATPILGLPYPTPDDQVDVPRDVKALAEAVEARGGLIVGEIRFIAVPNPPPGFLAPDGRAISRAAYPELFAAIGTRYGAGDGSTTFNLPPVAGRALIGAGAGAGLTPRVEGAVVGEEAHRLLVVEMPSHNHGGGTGSASTPAPILQNTSESTAVSGIGPYGGDAKTSFTHAHTITPQGGDGTHNNVQPSLVVPAYIYAGR